MYFFAPVVLYCCRFAYFRFLCSLVISFLPGLSKPNDAIHIKQFKFICALALGYISWSRERKEASGFFYGWFCFNSSFFVRCCCSTIVRSFHVETFFFSTQRKKNFAVLYSQAWALNCSIRMPLTTHIHRQYWCSIIKVRAAEPRSLNAFSHSCISRIGSLVYNEYYW